MPPQPPRAGRAPCQEKSQDRKAGFEIDPYSRFGRTGKNNGRKNRGTDNGTLLSGTEPQSHPGPDRLARGSLARKAGPAILTNTFFNDYIDIDSLAFLGVTRTPDSVYANRLRALVSPVQLPFNPIVKNYIRRYVDTRYGTINRVLSLSRYYFPLIEEELIKADLPVELRALPIIESALSTTATSPMGAVGLWQFMPATGKSYGLEINSFVDDVGTRCKRPAPPAVT